MVQEAVGVGDVGDPEELEDEELGVVYGVPESVGMHLSQPVHRSPPMTDHGSFPNTLYHIELITSFALIRSMQISPCLKYGNTPPLDS